MPPWAQTLCERLTGVRLMTSTSTPPSASFIAAARPASPPPTTSTRCLAIFFLFVLLVGLTLAKALRRKGIAKKKGEGTDQHFLLTYYLLLLFAFSSLRVSLRLSAFARDILGIHQLWSERPAASPVSGGWYIL